MDSMITPDFSEFNVAPASGGMADLATMLERLRDKEKEIADAELALTALKTTHKEMSQREIPDLMARLGVESFKTKSGVSVKIKPDVYCSIKKENQNKAFEWLESTDNGGLIKREVSVAFAAGQDEQAHDFIASIEETYAGNIKEDKWVEPQTLKAFVKKRLAAEEDGKVPEDQRVPRDVFNVLPFQVAKIEYT